MESRRHIDLAQAGLKRGRTVWLLVVGLFLGVLLVAVGIGLGRQGRVALEDVMGAGVASSESTPKDEGAVSLTPIEFRYLQRQDDRDDRDDREALMSAAPSMPVDAGGFDETRVWTLRFVPLHPDGFALSGIEAQLVAPQAVTSHWRGRVPLGPGGAVELEVSGSPAAILRGDLWVGTDPRALVALDGRILRGEPSTSAGARLDLGSLASVDTVDSMNTVDSVDAGARVLDLGRVTLRSPSRIGAVSLQGSWATPVQVLVTANTAGRGGDVWSESRRRFELAAPGGVLVVSAYLKDDGSIDEKWSASAWTGEDSARASERALVGTEIQLECPTPRGLDLSVDVAALPKASRIVIPAVGSSHASVLGKDAYQALLTSARWTAVVPQSILKSGKARYDPGFVSLRDGPVQLEVWSVRDEKGLRSLLLQSSVDVQGDVLPVLLR